ncbi:ribonuclease [Heyndrickxia shackletonii]|uniref:Ribonuclease n=1 Tax=Heyndrickxia shackletonii TaxID=157838 RepID=A0A0Q3WZ31_9BACI|nr:YlzJ-like family protein [Heyndrickxia shackletonii]KQL54578.1 ribonuclease [Heyndrickxia shackletonii]MBB2478609.1 YlzJ-like family protein [Bacillus sp. APMAM]NEY98220.1 ribonuclease [Heyndrickxia shackletonii]RTZ57755.1 ribonuclease [Bacillus sp. SAJ1]
MILYTTVPQELIFPTDTSAYSRQEFITYNGIPMIVEKVEDGKRVIRILSTDPADYLENSIMPGQII